MAKQNYSDECEQAINKQINVELGASYAYMAFAFYFAQDNVALPNAVKFFKKASHEERDHAEKLATYQVQRGGRVVYEDVKKPVKTAFTTLQEAFETALEMERSVNQSLLNIHALADEHADPALADYIESEFLSDQVEAIKQMADYVTQTKRAGGDLGEYLFDKLTLCE